MKQKPIVDNPDCMDCAYMCITMKAREQVKDVDGMFGRNTVTQIFPEEMVCRRNPPHPEHGFPKVYSDMWCGEYKERKRT